MNGLLMGLLGGGISALATIAGGFPILSQNSRVIQLLKNINMDFVIGVMLSASAFSLIIPAFNRSTQMGLLLLTLLCGVLFIKSVGFILEKINLKNDSLKNNKSALLFIIAMMAHNLPEGIAAGASMTIGETHQSYSLLSAIAIQNIPEGLTTALSFIAIGVSPLFAFLGNLSTGLVELIGGIIGGYLSAKIEGSLPLMMAFAGGAMMSVTIMEMMARVKEKSFRFFIQPGFISGIALMLTLSKI